MLSGGKMDQFLQAIYRQHQNAAYMNAAYLESYKELAKLQAQQEKELRRIETERAQKPVRDKYLPSTLRISAGVSNSPRVNISFFR